MKVVHSFQAAPREHAGQTYTSSLVLACVQDGATTLQQTGLDGSSEVCMHVQLVICIVFFVALLSVLGARMPAGWDFNISGAHTSSAEKSCLMLLPRVRNIVFGWVSP